VAAQGRRREEPTGLPSSSASSIIEWDSLLFSLGAEDIEDFHAEAPAPKERLIEDAMTRCQQLRKRLAASTAQKQVVVKPAVIPSTAVIPPPPDTLPSQQARKCVEQLVEKIVEERKKKRRKKRRDTEDQSVSDGDAKSRKASKKDKKEKSKKKKHKKDKKQADKTKDDDSLGEISCQDDDEVKPRGDEEDRQDAERGDSGKTKRKRRRTQEEKEDKHKEKKKEKKRRRKESPSVETEIQESPKAGTLTVLPEPQPVPLAKPLAAPPKPQIKVLSAPPSLATADVVKPPLEVDQPLLDQAVALPSTSPFDQVAARPLASPVRSAPAPLPWGPPCRRGRQCHFLAWGVCQYYHPPEHAPTSAPEHAAPPLAASGRRWNVWVS